MDIFDPAAPIEYLADTFDIIRRCSDLTFLTLTKRPEFFCKAMANVLTWEGQHNPYEPSQFWCWLHRWAVQGDPPKNVWLGVSVEDQETADERIPQLLNIPAVVRFLSVEPFLEPIVFNEWHPPFGGLAGT